MHGINSILQVDFISSAQTWEEYNTGNKLHKQLSEKYTCSTKTIHEGSDSHRSQKDDKIPREVMAFNGHNLLGRNFNAFKDSISKEKPL